MVLRAMRAEKRPLNRYAIQRLSGIENTDTALAVLRQLVKDGLIIRMRHPGDRRALLWSAVPPRRTLPGGVLKAEFFKLPEWETEA